MNMPPTSKDALNRSEVNAHEMQVSSGEGQLNELQSVAAQASNATYLTDETSPTIETQLEPLNISNDAFIQAIFGEIDTSGDVRPLVISFTGDPGTNKAWQPRSWPCDTADGNLNWYACPSDFVPDAAGYYRAQRKNARSVYCIMLDDLGSKVPFDRLEKTSFSWLLETSPGNFQAGFIFDEPIDIKSAEALKQAMLAAGLSDLGSKGAAVRWMRLPHAINGKKAYGDPSPRCKLVLWKPDLRYSIDALYELLKLDNASDTTSIKDISKLAPNSAGAAQVRSVFGVYLPKDDENYVLTSLKVKGLYKQDLGGGKHDVTCPWVAEHTDQIDRGCCYFEPSDMFPIGGYKCHHSHGDLYRIKELLTFLGVSIGQAKHKSEIYLRPGELHRVVSGAEKELALSGRYFQRGGLIVSVSTDPTSLQTIVKPVSAPALVNVLSKILTFYRPARKGAYEVCDPPARPITSLYDAERYGHLKNLVGLARQPHFRPDGSLVRDAGYDEVTGLYGCFDARKFGVPEYPTKHDAESALVELKSLLSEFNFASPQDEASALAAMLTAVTRASLPLAPMFHIKAPQIGSGKSYLSSIIAKLASPSVFCYLVIVLDEEKKDIRLFPFPTKKRKP